jgi:hypothetical protein
MQSPQSRRHKFDIVVSLKMLRLPHLSLEEFAQEHLLIHMQHRAGQALSGCNRLNARFSRPRIKGLRAGLLVNLEHSFAAVHFRQPSLVVQSTAQFGD